MTDENATREGGGAEAGLGRAAEALRAADVAAAGLARSVGADLRRALEGALFRSRTLGDALRGLAADMARSTLRSALAPLRGAATEGLTALASGAFGALGGGLGAATRRFARGGVLPGPELLATRGGPALAGEAGPEAILPLARGADGRLGVRGGAAPVSVTIQTPDAASFRRSEAQVARALARAVARGRRKL